jgi:hypothetical protein
LSFSLPYPSTPANGNTLDATPILANFIAIQQAIAAFDGSQINASSIAASSLVPSANPNSLVNDITYPFISSGLVWTTVSGLIGTMSSGVLFYNGIPVTVNAVASETFTASKDTYIDIDKNDNVTYQAVSNGSAAPSLTANSLRVAKVVTGASAISSISQTGVDSLNNQIYPTSPSLPLNWISYTPIFANTTLGNGTVSGRYIQIGKTIFFWAKFVLGSTSAVASTPTVTLPVATSGNYSTNQPIGDTVAFTSLGVTPGISLWNSTTTSLLTVNNASGTYDVSAVLTSSVPAAWASTNYIYVTGTYEAA